MKNTGRWTPAIATVWFGIPAPPAGLSRGPKPRVAGAKGRSPGNASSRAHAEVRSRFGGPRAHQENTATTCRASGQHPRPRGLGQVRVRVEAPRGWLRRRLDCTRSARRPVAEAHDPAPEPRPRSPGPGWGSASRDFTSARTSLPERLYCPSDGRRAEAGFPPRGAHLHHAAAQGILLSVGWDEVPGCQTRVQEVDHGEPSPWGVEETAVSSRGRVPARAGVGPRRATAGQHPLHPTSQASGVFETPGEALRRRPRRSARRRPRPQNGPARPPPAPGLHPTGAQPSTPRTTLQLLGCSPNSCAPVRGRQPTNAHPSAGWYIPVAPQGHSQGTAPWNCGIEFIF